MYQKCRALKRNKQKQQVSLENYISKRGKSGGVDCETRVLIRAGRTAQSQLIDS